MDAPTERPRFRFPNPYPDKHAARVQRDLGRVLAEQELLERKAEERRRAVEAKEEAAKTKLQKFFERLVRAGRRARTLGRSRSFRK